MKTPRILSLALCLSILNASCSKEIRYSKEAMLDKAKAADSSVTVILPKTMSEGVNCSQYTSGCLAGHIVRIQNLDMIAIEFSTEEQAIFAAKKFRGYYFANWFFDDVAGEPTLEKFVESALEAKKP